MYKATALKEALIGLIGWRQNDDTAGTQLSELTTSSSGLWFNDIHPLLSFDALLSLFEQKSIVYSTWDIGITYAKGEKVLYSGTNYYSLQASNVGNTPDSAPTYWKEFNEFTLWLKTITEAGIAETIDDWFSLKTNFESAKNLLEDDQLFRTSGSGSADESDLTSGQMFGFEIVPLRSLGVLARIRELSFHPNDEESGLKIELWKANGGTTAVQDTTFTAGDTAVPVWKTVDWELDPESTYYLLFNKTNVDSAPINGVRDYHRDDNGSIRMPCSEYLAVNACKYPSVFNNSELSLFEYTSEDNFGINVRFDVYCDYTDFVINQKNLFKGAFLRKVALKIIRMFLFNPMAQQNRYVNRIGTDTLLFELEGDTRAKEKTGLKHEYIEQLNAIRFDKKAIASECLPCKKKRTNLSSVFKM